MHRTCLLVTLFFLIAAPPILAADKSGKEDSQGRGWAMDVKVGTLGIGADLSRSIVPRVLNLRAGVSFFPYSTNFTDDGIDYRAKFKLGAVPVAVDIFPFKNWFRLGGGVVFNLTEVDGTGQTSTGFFKIGDNQYSAASIGQLKAILKANRTVPYFGIGFNNPIKRSGHWGFFLDLGALYHGTPSVRITTTQTIPQLQADIAKQVQDVNDDIRDYKYFPVFQLGFSYKF
jgi:hypothetical protein